MIHLSLTETTNIKNIERGEKKPPQARRDGRKKILRREKNELEDLIWFLYVNVKKRKQV